MSSSLSLLLDMRYAIRRTQKQVDAARKGSKQVDTLDRSQLQALAKERGIKANQSTEALREQLQ